MKKRFAVLALLVFSASADLRAQGIVGGAKEGSADGAAAAGPVGAVVGGAVGAVTGGVAGLFGLDQRALFHEYVLREGHPSYAYNRDLRAGDVLPLEDVTYYPVPPEFGVAREYRYAIINDEAVIVDPRTHRIVQVID
jgi:Protein of unknown function (DUF1236)